MHVATSSPVTAAVLAALEGLGVDVGDATQPPMPSPPPRASFPYCVVFTGISRLAGDLLHPNEDGLHRIHVKSVGLDRDGAEWLRDRVRPVLLDRELPIDGHAITWSELVTSLPTQRDDVLSPPRFYANDVFHLFVTPVPGS